jgi:hypothetical protein
LRSQTKSTQGGTRDPAPQWAQQLDQLERSAELIERLLGDPQLRRRFRSDPATVLVEAGLPELAAGLGPGRRAMMTLELRESRSSLAGMMVAAAAEGVDFAHFAERAVPDLAHDAGHALDHLVSESKHAAPAHDPAAVRPAEAAPAKPSIGPPARIPKLDSPAAAAHPARSAPPRITPRLVNRRTTRLRTPGPHTTSPPRRPR